MATYYVRTTGSDGAAGTSAGTAWLTIGKALGAAGIASGDTVYVGAGTYRETVSVGMTSATVETSVIADVDGSHTGDAGPVVWTAYTTNDTTVPSATVTLNLNGKDFLTFTGFTIVGAGASPSCVAGSTVNSINIKFQNCTFIPARVAAGGAAFAMTASADIASNWTIERCAFLAGGGAILQFTLTRNASSTFGHAIVIRNCLFVGHAGTGYAVQVTTTGGGSGTPGGVSVVNCTSIGPPLVVTSSANISTTTNNIVVTGNFVICQTSGALSANTSGQITSSYNLIHPHSATALTNVSAGTGDVTDGSRAPLISFGQEWMTGAPPRPFGTPLAGSPLLGWQSVSGADTVDMLNRPRPAGGVSAANAVGALERHDTAISPGTTVGADAGSGYIEIVGMGDHDFDVPVDAVAQTISIKTKTSGYSGTNYPQMIIRDGGAIGVADQTVTATSASASAYETLTSSSFTPTAKGVVTVRLTNRSANGTGIAAFDTFAVT